MSRRLVFIAAAAAPALLSFAVRGPLHADARAPQSLTSLVAPQSLVRDTNGDGLADAVAARIVVPAAPSLADVEAATNLAARLGYETTALTLPLVVKDTEVAQPAAIAVPILVGRTNRFVQRLIETKAIDVASLQPGQGIVAAVASPLGGGDGLVVVGGDDEGTLNAGVELAARLPRVWGMNGITLAAVEEQAIRYLRGRGVNASGAGISTLLVDSSKRGIARAVMRITVADADGARAAKLLEDLEAAHRRGQEPKTLDFTNIATTAIDVVSAARVVAHVDVSRTGLNQRTLTPPIDPDELAPDSPGERGAPAAGAAPAAAPGRSFDLTNAATSGVT